jgi:non-homologous end joining protein Ku
MPRASWRGFLRLSLVSCPIYLSPATTRAKSIRLHQVWQPAPVDVAEENGAEIVARMSEAARRHVTVEKIDIASRQSRCTRRAASNMSVSRRKRENS